MMKYGFLVGLILCSNLMFAQPGDEVLCAKQYHSATLKGPERARILEDYRLHHYDVQFYYLDIEASNTSTFIAGEVEIIASVTVESFTEFVIELANALTVEEVSINGTPASFTHANNTIVATSPVAYAAGDRLEVSIAYGGLPPSGDSFFQGISNGTDEEWGQPITWTLSEPFNASDWWPVKQVLTDKADSAYIYITVPQGIRAGASGVLVDVVQLEGDRQQFQWQTSYPIAYYLISMAIGDYKEYTTEVLLPGNQEPTPILNYLYDHPQLPGLFQPLLDQVGDQAVIFSDLFGTYPYADEKYGHAMAPMGGGMEHQTMSTMSTFTFRLIAHELAHQWFGDMITCADWSDIWINEGFARYAEYLALEHLESREEADMWMRLLQNNVRLEPDGSVYVPRSETDNVFRIFNGRLTYNKGGAIMHTLRYMIDDDPLFFSSMRSYADTFRDSIATGADFRDSMMEHSGIDLGNFFKEWYYGEGYPIYDITWKQRNDSLIVEAEQSVSAPEKTSFFSTPMPIGLTLNGRDTVFRFTPETSSQVFKVFMPGNISQVSFDPEGYLINVHAIRNSDITALDPEPSTVIQAFPNPASDAIHVLLPNTGQWQVRLMDVNGRVMISLPHPTTTDVTLQTSHLASGIYFLEATSLNMVYQIRVALRR